MTHSMKLHELYFNLIADLFGLKTWDSSIINHILTEISKHLEIDYLALYVYFEKSNTLRLLSAYSTSAKYIPESLITAEDVVPEHFFKRLEKVGNVSFLPLQPQDSDTMILVYKRTKPLDEEMLLTVMKETEKLLSIVNRRWNLMNQDKNNKFLLDTSTKLMKANDKEDVLQKIVDALDKVYEVESYHLILTQEYQAGGLPVKVLEYKDGSAVPVSTQVFMTGEMQIDILKEDYKKIIYAPLIGEQSVYGVLEITVPLDKYLTGQEMEFVEDFAALAGKALERTILYSDSLARVNNLTLLNEIIHKLNATRELKELTELIQQEIITIAHASEVGFIYFGEESSGEFEILEGSTALFSTEEGKRIAEKYRGEIMRAPESIFSGNAPILPEAGNQSLMVIPMVYSGLTLGFTIILHEEPYHFTFENFKLIESLMHHSVLAISNTILRERLQTTVITDFLTQLYSRRYLEDTLEEHYKEGETGVLLLFDIDNFKKVNDTHGHHIGDRVLKQVARLMESVVGDEGIVARWGGEELAIYLPERIFEDGKRLADQIRGMLPRETNPSITASCGLSQWRKEDDESPETLFLRADKALYQAKNSGKNQVCSL